MSQSFVSLLLHLASLPSFALAGWYLSRRWGTTRLKLWPSAPVPPSAPSSASLPLRGPRIAALLTASAEKKIAVLLLFLIGASASAGDSDAVVCLPSHGGSGTVIATGQGWTLILSCAHCFEDGGDQKPVKIVMPYPTPGSPKKVGTKVLAVGNKETVDISLIRLNYGPVPYVAPVAPLSGMPREGLSIGFDAMEFPANVRQAKIVKSDGRETLTDARPWHGRSGGALIDKQTGNLIGVVSAYTMTERESRAKRRPREAEYMSGAYGVYVSLPAIHRFLTKAGVMQHSAPDDFGDPFSESFRPRPSPRIRPSPGFDSCPDRR